MITTFLIYFSIVLAYVPWLKPFWMDLQRRSIWIPPPKITAFLGYLKFCFNDSKIILLLILPLLLFFFLNEVKKIRDGNEWKPSLSLSNPTFLVLLWVCVPFSIAFFKSILSTPVLIYRNLIISLPAVYLLFARSVKVLPLKPINRFGIIFGIIVLLLTHNLFVNKYYTRPHKEQFREATDYIIEHDSNFGQASIIVGHSTRGKRYDYYFNKRNYPKRPEIIAGLKQDIPRLSQMISMRNPQYIWYISVHRLPDKEFLDYLNRQFQLLEVKSFIKGKVWLFKNRSEKSSERKINMNS